MEDDLWMALSCDEAGRWLDAWGVCTTPLAEWGHATGGAECTTILVE